MSYTITVSGWKSGADITQESNEVLAAIKALVETLKSQGHTVSGGQTRLPDGRTIDALNLAKGEDGPTAEPSTSSARSAPAVASAPSGPPQPAQTPKAAPGGSWAAPEGTPVGKVTDQAPKPGQAAGGQAKGSSAKPPR